MKKVREGKDKDKKDQVKGVEDKKDKANKEQKSWFERSGYAFDGILKDAKDKNYFEERRVKMEGGFFTRQLKHMHFIKKSEADKKARDELKTKLAF